jgi:hypothetical protein
MVASKGDWTVETMVDWWVDLMDKKPGVVMV